MNDGGVPYSIGNPVGDDYKADFSGLGEYFDVYGIVKTRYSQVYWTRNDPVPLPKEIVDRFKGKVMAITGYEADQVVKTPEGDKSIPIYHQYNHHYFAWLTSVDAEVLDGDEWQFMPNPTKTIVRDREGYTGDYPTNIVFKENPGGEYRKSYHGYPEGYAQLIQSPNEFVLEPMQIDTHNREFSPSAYNDSGHVEWFLPAMEKGKNDLRSGLSPLIECPCSNRIEKTTINESQILNKDTCKSTISSAEQCKDMISASVSSFHASETVSNSSLPSGCLVVPNKDGSFDAVFNSAKSSVKCGDASAKSMYGKSLSDSLVELEISHDGVTATLTLTGPDKVWFGIGFNAHVMADAPYAIIVDGNGKVSERKLVDHGPGVELNTTIKVVSNIVKDGSRTVVLTRPVVVKDYSIPVSPGTLSFINAIGNSVSLAYHAKRSSSMLTLLNTDALGCFCAPEQKTYISYMGQSKEEFSIFCDEWPRSDMARQNNPACKLQTYHGGLRCCKHTWFLTDKEQDHLIPDAVDEYYLKFRFYFQEYVPATSKTPASHQHLHHWVFLIDNAVNDYEESQCEDGSMCEGSIAAQLTVRTMGIEDIPKSFKGVTPLVITAHCHAPSCIREELYNDLTGDLLCRAEAKYGQGTAHFDERDYIALPPCLFGHQPGLRKPITLDPDTPLRAIKVFNNSYRHLGQMAQWTGLMVYDL